MLEQYRQQYRHGLTQVHQPASMELSFGMDRILNMTCSTELKNRELSFPVIQKPTGATKKPVTKSRRRTIFTEHQLSQMEQTFAQSKYLVGNQRVDLATELGLETKSVKIWFQNRRIKHRRRNSDHSSNSTTSDSD